MYDKCLDNMYDLIIIIATFRSFDLWVERRLLSQTEYRVGILLSLIQREKAPDIVLASGQIHLRQGLRLTTPF